MFVPNIQNEKAVNIVHCVDTEGPLYESSEATFERIYDIFGVKYEPTLQNLEMLRQGKDKAIAEMISLELLDYNDTWDKIDVMLNEITSKDFRHNFPDSFENGWKYTWFCIDWVGFMGENPRRRDMGFHNIFDHYTKYKEDEIQFHFHPISIKKDAHLTGNTYSPIIYETLARKIIDRLWFPSAVRSGVERPDSSFFFEQWIPFVYGNSSMKINTSEQFDLSDGRFGDWRHAPLEWMPYHPDYRDYQEKGNCHRLIARCLNMEARVKEISINDFRDGFKRASEGLPTLISFADHDYRNMKKEINRTQNMIRIVSGEYPDVKFRYCNANEGIRNVTNTTNLNPPKFSLTFDSSRLNVISENNIFGTQPFLAIKTKSGEYIWQNLDYRSDNWWTFTFDFYTLPKKAIDKIGIASNTDNGMTEIVVLDVDSNTIKRRVLHE